MRATFRLQLPTTTLPLGTRTLVMGVLNVTPDSFADGGRHLDPDTAVAAAHQMVSDGADLIDIGGESTRPGAAPLPADEEWHRVGPVIERLAGSVGVPLSIDTYKAEIADRALALGAAIVNDVSGLTYDGALAGVVARRHAAVVLMHTRGRSADMYARAQYADVVGEIAAELAGRVADAESAGIARSRIVVDPGLGFAKTADQSWLALAGLGRLAALGLPILSGPSRKSFLTAATGEGPPAERVWATAAAVTASILAGAHIVRVHDVREMVQVARAADRVLATGLRGFC